MPNITANGDGLSEEQPMSETNIRWATHSWNPYLWRCTRVSPGCKNCYMMTMAQRYGQDPNSGV
ncbi:MAG: DUF5131 family protein, partial [Anaerolineae bacterium]|nr:DUF5131 family protein [Anaerolineae bacterium]